jgi:hypothetical protein
VSGVPGASPVGRGRDRGAEHRIDCAGQKWGDGDGIGAPDTVSTAPDKNGFRKHD